MDTRLTTAQNIQKALDKQLVEVTAMARKRILSEKLTSSRCCSLPECDAFIADRHGNLNTNTVYGNSGNVYQIGR